jgi:hypothetical protein
LIAACQLQNAQEGCSSMSAGSVAKAHEAIGEYFCAFSRLERELGEALKVVLRLQNNPAADAIVGIVGDFARKTRVVRRAVQTAKNVDGSDPQENWKANAVELLEEILGCNNPDRTDLAHDFLEPQQDGSVSLQKPGQEPRRWTAQSFTDKIAKLDDLAAKLKKVTSDLTTLRIPVPSGYMSVDPYQPRVRQFPPSDLGMGSRMTDTPLPAKDPGKHN